MILFTEVEKTSKTASDSLGRDLAKGGLEHFSFDYSLNRKGALLCNCSFFLAMLSNEGVKSGEEILDVDTDEFICIRSYLFF